MQGKNEEDRTCTAQTLLPITDVVACKEAHTIHVAPVMCHIALPSWVVT
jgi:hypothetical protein